MKLISGKTIAADIRETLRQRIESLKEAEKRLPKLSVILVGDDPASATYVRNKERACAQTGILSETIRMSKDTTQQALLDVIYRSTPMIQSMVSWCSCRFPHISKQARCSWRSNLAKMSMVFIRSM